MTVVFLTNASTSPWNRPGDWSDAGHTVRLIGAGGRGGVAVTGTAYRSGSGGGGGAHVLNTYSSGALSGTTPFYVTIDSFGITADAAATAWGSGTSSITNSYYVQGGTSGVSGGASGAGGSTTTTLNGTPSTPVYTQSLKFNGGNGGATAAILASAGGGGGAGGAAGAGGAGGQCNGGASLGAGGGGAGAGGGNGGTTASTSGGAGGGSGGAGGTSGTPAGGAGVSGGKGGGGGFFSAVASATTTGGAGGVNAVYTQTIDSATGGAGGGGGGGGANSVNTANAVTSGGVGAAYGGGGGGAGGTRNGTSTRTPGAGASGLIVITYTAAPASGTLAATEAADVAVFAGTNGDPFVSYGSQGTYLTYTSRTNSTLVAPSGIADGDFLIAYFAIAAGSTPPAVTAPAGWAELSVSPINSVDGSGFNVDYHVYYKVAASEAGNYVFTHVTGSTCGLVIRYTGVDTGSPFSPTATANKVLWGTGVGAVAIATGFTTTVANTFIIFTEHDWGDGTTDTVVPTGTTPTFTERVDQTLIYVADGTLASAGATGNKSHTCNSTTNNPNASYLIGLKPGVPVTATTGTLAVTEAVDIAAINGRADPVGTLATTEVRDVAAFPGGTVAWNAALAATEAANVAAFPGTVAWNATLAATEAANTAAASGTVAWNATLAVTEASDVAAFTATAVNLGTLAVTEAVDVSSFSGDIVAAVTGTLASTEAADVAAATGTVEWRATLAATETANVAAFASTVAWNATLAVTEASDTASVPATVAWNAALAVTEAPDVASLAGTVTTPTPGVVAHGSQGTYLSYASRTNSTLVAPSGITDGDFLIAYFAVGAIAGAPAATPPAGWTELSVSPIQSHDSSGFYLDYHIYYKTAASESGNYVFTHAAGPSCGVVIRYTGVDTASPFSPTPTANKVIWETGLCETAIATGFTTTVANTFVIFTEHDWGSNTTDTVVPTGTTPTFTERVDTVILYVADGTLASAGATGNKSHTCNSDTIGPNGSFLIGLKPGVAGPPTGTLVATEAADAASLSGNIVFPAVTGTLATTEAADLFSDVAPTSFEAWWNFASGAVDATGHGNDGTLHGTTLTTDQYGRPARSFNGSTDYIDGSSSPLEP